jgi:hypothetical protein
MGSRAKLNSSSFLLGAPFSTDSIFITYDLNLDMRFVLILNYKHVKTAGLTVHTVNVDFLRIEYMVLAKYQHMSILELILLVKQHILILCKNLLGVDVLIIVN